MSQLSVILGPFESLTAVHCRSPREHFFGFSHPPKMHAKYFFQQASKEVFRAETAMEEGRKQRLNLLSLSGNIINQLRNLNIHFEEFIEI